MVKAILFDLDGVLVNSMGLIKESISFAIDNLGLPKDEKLYDEVIAKDHKVAFRNIYPMHSNKVGDFDNLYKNYCLKNIEKTKLLPNVREILNILKEKKIIFGIVTTKDYSRTTAILDKFEIIPKALITCGDTLQTRPDPTPINLAIEKLNLTKEDVIYVGDTPLDSEQAKNAEVKCILISTGNFKEKELLKHTKNVITDLIQLGGYL